MLLIKNLEKDFTEHIMGYSAIAIIISTCLGGIAIMGSLYFVSGALAVSFVLATIAICGAHNAAILTVQKPAVIYKLLIASIVINSLIIAFTFLA